MRDGKHVILYIDDDPDILEAMLPHHPRISIMGLSETASDLPEFGPENDGEWGLGQMPDSSTSSISFLILRRSTVNPPTGPRPPVPQTHSPERRAR